MNFRSYTLLSQCEQGPMHLPLKQAGIRIVATEKGEMDKVMTKLLKLIRFSRKYKIDLIYSEAISKGSLR